MLIQHLAAAQLLLREAPKMKPLESDTTWSAVPMPGLNLVTALLIWDDTSKIDATKGAKASWTYLKTLGLDVVLIRTPTVPAGKYDDALQALPYALAESVFLAQQAKKYTPLDFDKCRGDTESVPLPIGQERTEESIQKIIRQDLSTSICMQLYTRFGVSVCTEFLSRALWSTGNVDHDKSVFAQAEAKVEELKKTVGSSKSPFFLFMWRQSDFNAHLNSREEHYKQLLAMVSDQTERVVPQLIFQRAKKILIKAPG